MSTPRKSKEFWAITETHQIALVTGWECPNAGMWWCPSVGFTGSVGHHLFEDKESARTKATEEIQMARISLNEQERSLKLL